jgi:hypothetical protein
MYVHTADDDSVPVPHGALKLPRAVLNWKTPPLHSGAWRTQGEEFEVDDTDVTPVDPPSDSRTNTLAASDAHDDDPTRAIQITVPPRTPERTAAREGLPALGAGRLQGLLARGAARFQGLLPRGAAHLDAARAHAAELWRAGPLRTAAMVAAAVLITYLAVGGGRRGGDNRAPTVLVPVAAPPAAAPIIVEQLSGSRQSSETAAAPLQAEESDKAGRRSASSRARVTSTPTTPVGKSGGYQVVAPAQSKPQSSRAERSNKAGASSSVELPAWGVEAVREFSSEKSSAGASGTSAPQTLTAKSASSNADIAPPMQPKAEPVVAAKPAEPVKTAEPAKPVAPPPPSKPLTMDQVLNQVEEAAQAQRKQAGLKAPKASKRDAELDELINGAMNSKTK